MKKAVLTVFFGLCLVFGLAGGAQAASINPGAPAHFGNGAIVSVAEATPASNAVPASNEVLHLDPPRLLFLGAGIATGLLFISPTLEITELFGVALGVIGGEFLYQTVYKRAESSFHTS